MQDLFQKQLLSKFIAYVCPRFCMCPREQGCFTDFPVSLAADPKVTEVSSEPLPRCAGGIDTGLVGVEGRQCVMKRANPFRGQVATKKNTQRLR